MEDQQNPTNKIALNYGIYLGFISILIHVSLFALGKHLEQDWKITVLSITIMAVLVALGIKKYKETNNGFLTLGQGLKTGIGVSLIGAVIYLVYYLLFIKVIAPDSVEQGLEIARQKLLDIPSLSEEQIEAQIEMQKKFSTPGILAAVILIFNLLLGFVISLIASLVMQKKENEY